MAAEQARNLSLDGLRQKRARAVAQNLGQRIGKSPWLRELKNISVGHGVSLLCWRSGGLEWVTPTGNRDAGKLAADATQLPTGCQPESLAKPARRRSHKATQPQLLTRRASSTIIRLGQKDIASMSAAFEAALGQLGLIERNDLATMAIAKVIIGLAKEGERDAGRLGALALKRI